MKEKRTGGAAGLSDRGGPLCKGIPLRIQDAGPAPRHRRAVAPGGHGAHPEGGCAGWGGRCAAGPSLLLRLCLPLAPGDDAGALANAGRLLTLEGWVAAQSAAHTLPVFGDGLPQGETLRAANGKLERVDAAGTARYTLRLRAEFTEIYKEDTP